MTTLTIYAAGDLASVTDPRTGHVLPSLAQVALEEGETVARNLAAEVKGKPLEAFTFHDKGLVVSVGTRRGVANVAGITSGGRMAHLLKDAIEWEYRQSVKHLRGWIRRLMKEGPARPRQRAATGLLAFGCGQENRDIPWSAPAS